VDHENSVNLFNVSETNMSELKYSGIYICPSTIWNFYGPTQPYGVLLNIP